MSHQTHDRNRIIDKIVGLSASLLFMGSAHMASAQSAEIFLRLEDPALVVSDAGGQGVSGVDNPLMVKASRFAGSEVDEFVQIRLDQISMKGRATDPFGLFQDTTVKPVVEKKEIKRVIRSNPSAPQTPLSEIVKLIKVTTLIPAENKFMVEGRVFSQSEEMPIIYQGRPMSLEVIGVSASEVAFRDVDTDERAVLKVQSLPAGMRASGSDDNLQGIIGSDVNAPLQLNGSSGLR